MADSDDTPESTDEESGEGKKVGGKKKLIVIIAIVLLLVGVGAGLFFSGIIGGKKADKETEEAAEDGHGDEEAEDDGHGGGHGEEEEADEGGHGGGHGEKEKGGHGKDGKKTVKGPVYYDLPEFIVNLQTGTNPRPSFLKMKVTLELASGADKEVLEAQKPRIMDILNTYLREMRASDLSNSGGLYRLREEMLMRINKLIAPKQVKDILFTEIIVQ